MKRLTALVCAVVFILALAGCGSKSMNDIIGSEPNMTGIVKETSEDAVLIENENGTYWVSLNVENKDGIYSPIMAGDEVTVYYNGDIAESDPMQIQTVYAILLIEPADRTVNENA